MDENKNQEDILNDEIQTDESDEILNEDGDISEYTSDDENDYTPILGEDAETDYTPILGEDAETDFLADESIDVKKSNTSMKILIPVIIVLAAVIVALLMLMLNGSRISNLSNSSESALASSEAEVPDPSFKIDGKQVDTDDLVFLKIGDNEVGFDELRNCYYQFLNSYGQYYGISEDTFKDLSGDDRESMFSSFKNTLAEYVKGGYVHAVYAQENNITFDADDEKAVEEQIQSIKDEQGDNYEEFLKENYMTEKYLNIAIKNNVLSEKVEDALSVSEKDFYKTAKKELYQVKQIFIPFGSEEKIPDETLSANSIEDYSKLSKPDRAQVIVSNYDSLSDDQQTKAKKASKKVADKLYKKIKSGADFDKLMKNNTYDSLYESYPKGILVGKDYEYDEDYLEAALSLKENEVSKVIESSSGYHIIMRVPLDKKYIKKNVSYFAETYNDNAVNKVLYEIYDNIEVEQTDTYKNFNFGDLT